jgi:5-methylcytosine-specific restriction endonuclease McrA
VSNWWDRNKHRYPGDWTVIANRVKDAAGWRCEACGNPHGPSPYVLTVDHVVDHDPQNVADENLAALCQRCHLRRQGMRPKPRTKAEAIERLKARYESEQSQLVMEGFGA